MGEARELVEVLVATMIVECLAILLFCLVAYFRTPKEPHDIFKVPDYVPDDLLLSHYRVQMPSSPRLHGHRVFWTTVEAESHDEAMDKALPILWAMEDAAIRGGDRPRPTSDGRSQT